MDMTLEERMQIIENKANKDREEKNRAAQEKKDKTILAIEQVKELTPRIHALITLANKCITEGIAFPAPEETTKYGYGDGYRSYNFLADGINHHVGFMDARYSNVTEIKYLGINNGGYCGVWDFYTNGEKTFLKHENDCTVKDAELSHINAFLKEFSVFEEAFYKWVDSLA